MGDFTTTVEAELTGHGKSRIWLRVPTRRHNGTVVIDPIHGTGHRVLTYPIDVVSFKAGTYPKGTRLAITTDNAEVYNDGHGFRMVGGIGSVELVELPEVQEDDDA